MEDEKTCPTWNVYVGLVLNILIIIISLGKQALNSKKQINITDILLSLKNTNGVGKEAIDIPEDLKSSKQK